MIRAIKTRCRSCGSSSCSRRPIGSFCSETEGCDKFVSELDGDKYYHYAVEVKPQLIVQSAAGKDMSKVWREYADFVEYIDNKPAGDYFKR